MSSDPPALVYFGGTFDPPHLGHLRAVRGLREELGLPVLVVPTGRPAHRPEPAAPPGARAAMVERALQSLRDSQVSLCRRELENPRPSFTWDTVSWLRSERPQTEVLLALGADAALGLPGWHEAASLLAAVRLVLFDRPGSGGSAEEALLTLGRQRLVLDSPLVLHLDAPEIDASGLRDRLRLGWDCDAELAPGVGAYIRQHRLYGSPSDRR